LEKRKQSASVPAHGEPAAKLTIDPAEVIALRTILMVLAGTLASEHELRGLGSARTWIGHLVGSCREAVLRAPFPGVGCHTERIRREILDSLDLTFESIDFDQE
jgi:hypothetical protein